MKKYIFRNISSAIAYRSDVVSYFKTMELIRHYHYNQWTNEDGIWSIVHRFHFIGVIFSWETEWAVVKFKFSGSFLVAWYRSSSSKWITRQVLRQNGSRMYNAQRQPWVTTFVFEKVYVLNPTKTVWKNTGIEKTPVSNSERKAVPVTL